MERALPGRNGSENGWRILLGRSLEKPVCPECECGVVWDLSYTYYSFSQKVFKYWATFHATLQITRWRPKGPIDPHILRQELQDCTLKTRRAGKVGKDLTVLVATSTLNTKGQAWRHTLRLLRPYFFCEICLVLFYILFAFTMFQVFPKRCGHLDGKALVPIAEATDRDGLGACWHG